MTLSSPSLTVWAPTNQQYFTCSSTQCWWAQGCPWRCVCFRSPAACGQTCRWLWRTVWLPWTCSSETNLRRLKPGSNAGRTSSGTTSEQLSSYPPAFLYPWMNILRSRQTADVTTVLTGVGALSCRLSIHTQWTCFPISPFDTRVSLRNSLSHCHDIWEQTAAIVNFIRNASLPRASCVL